MQLFFQGSLLIYFSTKTSNEYKQFFILQFFCGLNKSIYKYISVAILNIVATEINRSALKWAETRTKDIKGKDYIKDYWFFVCAVASSVIGPVFWNWFIVVWTSTLVMQ